MTVPVAGQFWISASLWNNDVHPEARRPRVVRCPGSFRHSPSSSPLPYANCLQGMGGHRPRSRRGRAARHPAQGWHSRRPQAFRARPRSLLPVPHLRAPSERRRARLASAGAAPGARGGRLAGRRAFRPRADPRRRHPAARARPHPRMGRGRRPLAGHGSAHGRRALPVLRLDHGLRREAPLVEALPSAARDPAAHLPHPAAGDRQGPRRLLRPPLRGSRSRATFRSRARPCSPTRSSTAPRRRSRRSSRAASSIARRCSPDGGRAAGTAQ